MDGYSKRSPRDLETITADLKSITADLETMIWKLWGQIWKLGTADLETMRSDLETGNSGFGNYDLETKARDSETMTANLETMIWKLCGQIWKLGTADLETMIWKLRHVIWKVCVGNHELETMNWKLWMGNFCRSFGNWKEQRRLSTLPGLFNILSTAQQHVPSAPPHPISNVASCQCARPGTLLAPPHPTPCTIVLACKCQGSPPHPSPPYQHALHNIEVYNRKNWQPFQGGESADTLKYEHVVHDFGTIVYESHERVS